MDGEIGTCHSAGCETKNHPPISCEVQRFYGRFAISFPPILCQCWHGRTPKEQGAKTVEKWGGGFHGQSINPRPSIIQSSPMCISSFFSFRGSSLGMPLSARLCLETVPTGLLSWPRQEPRGTGALPGWSLGERMLSHLVLKFTPRYQVVLGNVSLPVGSSGGHSGRVFHGPWYPFALLASFAARANYCALLKTRRFVSTTRTSSFPIAIPFDRQVPKRRARKFCWFHSR